MIGLLRLVFQLALIGALAFWLANDPGTAHIVWHGFVIETSAAFLVVCLLALAFVVHFVFRFLAFLRDAPSFWRLRRKLNQIKTGQDHFAKGLVALAEGRPLEAGRQTLVARKYLGNTVAAQWLQAQAAHLAKDHTVAQEIFRSLAIKDDTAILGYRGLIAEAHDKKEWDEVDRLLAEARRLAPTPPWLNLVVMESAARHRQWDEAEKALAQAASERLIDPETTRRIKAAIKLAASRTAAMASDPETALQTAEQAVKQAPMWLPATINLAETLATANHPRAATRALSRAWKTTPHPHLARTLLRLAATPLEGFKNVEKLCQTNPSAYESHYALAEAALMAEVWGEARRNLMLCINDRNATRGVYKMLAQLERHERRDERSAATWLAKAAEASPDPSWLCPECGMAHENWHALCTTCGAFNALEWQVPGKQRTAAPDTVSGKDVLAHV